jgi:hypothetical protein
VIDFDVDKIGEQVKKGEDLFDFAAKLLDDPLVQEALKQFARGVLVSVAIAVVKHGFYQYKQYKSQRFEMTVDEVIDSIGQTM